MAWRIVLGLLFCCLAVTIGLRGGILLLLLLIAIPCQFLSCLGWLKLDEKGFTFWTLFGSRTTRWGEVETFVMITSRALVFIPVRRQIGWRFSASRNSSIVNKAAGAITGYNACLPETYGMKAQDLMLLLESWRVEALRRQQAA